ncbi:MAG TPA: MFS transporter [Terrimesophilobacter sp.]|nr:MFS transporter [Terrimesophilobacter sp.]
MGGIGFGAVVSVGAILAAEVSGSEAWSGMAATMSTLGAALFAIPMARAAEARGRRISLTLGASSALTGVLVATLAAGVGSFPLLLVGLALAGAASAANLQARFAATDLSLPDHRARHLSLVVWSTTVGAVAGPNLVEPGEWLGAQLGMPELTGPFLFTIVAQVLVIAVYLSVLRPDPLLTALADAPPKPRARRGGGFVILRHNPAARHAVATISLSHATMVALMAMTPVHLYGHGASLAIVGFVISLHIAGMYALSPLFGWMSDRWGRIPTILFGQGMLFVSLVIAWVGSHSEFWVTVSLVLLGTGWSASTIAGSTLVVESVHVDERAGLQGASDFLMNILAATGGALAGPVLAFVGYPGLGLACMVLVAVVVVWTLVRSRSLKQFAPGPEPEQSSEQAPESAPVG